MTRFLLGFAVSLLGLSLVYNLGAVSRAVLTPWNQLLAATAYLLLQGAGVPVDLHDNLLTSPGSGFSVAVENDCNGAEATMILVAAMLAYPAGAARKLIGILLGTVLIQLVNVVRILALFQVGQWSESVFDLTHKYLWPALIIVIALGFFLWWVRRTSPGEGSA